MRRSAIVTLLVASILMTLPGCMGRFALVGRVTKFNLDVVESQWGRECVFLAMYIIPVYPICGLIDLWIINSIEFWSEINPIDGESAITLSKAVLDEDQTESGKTSAVALVQEDGSLLLRAYDDSGKLRETVVPAEEAEAILRQGRKVAVADTAP